MDFTPLIARQRTYFRSGATLPQEFRRAQLRRLLDLLEAHEDDLLAALHRDLRKSPQEAYASEMGVVLSEIRYALRHLAAWMKPARRPAPLLVWPARGSIRPEPYGLALIIGPWNYPLQLLLAPLVGSIAAGNCAILKPSEFAPHTAAVIGEIIGTAFSEEFIAVVQGEQATAEALLQQRFDTIFFTGSTTTGRAIMTAAARHLTPVTLELGGKCPCIVTADAPLATTARRIVWGKFMNAGQTCVAPDHVLVDQRIAGAFLAAAKQALREFYGADPQQSPDYGRIINRRHFDRLTRYLGDGKVICGGRHDAGDLYLEPTILTGVPWSAAVMRDEIFGPILPVLEFSNLDDVLSKLRERPTPLALYLFGTDRAVQDRVLAGSRSGGVCINDTVTHILGKKLPFGGLGESGMGAYHGRASFDCFTHRRSVLRRSLALDPPFRYPPPRVALKGLKRILRYLGAG
ncbi:MAG: aldehyde dehydrogenase [Akkermansiaceae bacterium]|nr:aldehyde dehydrogenase [Akkermansiaceae bacterium]MCF7734057.1 aldehyde dehydrogenase [Akkermansiaceae bacterium]